MATPTKKIPIIFLALFYSFLTIVSVAIPVYHSLTYKLPIQPTLQQIPTPQPSRSITVRVHNNRGEGVPGVNIQIKSRNPDITIPEQTLITGIDGVALIEKKDPSDEISEVSIRMQHPDTSLWSKFKMENVKGDSIDLIFENYFLPFGDIELNSSPSECVVSLSGRNIGKTPLKLSKYTPDTYDFKFHKDGYFDTTYRVKVFSTKLTNVDALLRQKPLTPGVLFIRVNPWGYIYLDDSSTNVLSANNKVPFRLSPGMHRWRIIHPKYKTRYDSLNVKPGSEIERNYDLE